MVGVHSFRYNGFKVMGQNENAESRLGCWEWSASFQDLRRSGEEEPLS